MPTPFLHTPVLILVLIFFELYGTSVSKGECGPKLNAAPTSFYTAKTAEISAAQPVTIQVGASRTLMLKIENTSKQGMLYTLMAYPVSGSQLRPYCTDSGGVDASSSVILEIKEVSFAEDLILKLVSSPKSEGLYIVYSDLNPKRPFSTKDVVRRNLYVFIFGNAPLASSARANVEAATRIWRDAGVDFKPVYRE